MVDARKSLISQTPVHYFAGYEPTWVRILPAAPDEARTQVRNDLNPFSLRDFRRTLPVSAVRCLAELRIARGLRDVVEPVRQGPGQRNLEHPQRPIGIDRARATAGQELRDLALRGDRVRPRGRAADGGQEAVRVF